MSSTLHAVPLSGGVNLFDDPRTIRDDELVYAKNLFPHQKGLTGKRLGAGCVGSGPIYGSLPTNLHVPPFLGVDWIATTADVGSGALSKAYVNLGRFDGNSQLNYEIPRIARFTPPLVPFGQDVYCPIARSFTVQDPGLGTLHIGAAVVKRNPNGVYSIGGVNLFNSALAPAVATSYRGRMVWGNFGRNSDINNVRRRTLMFSDKGNPVKIFKTGTADPLAAYGVELPALRGDQIIALVEVMLTQMGGLTQVGLLVLGERRSVLVTGQPEDTTYIGQFYERDLDLSSFNYEVGCMSHQTVVKTPYGIIWADKDDVWMFTTGQLPIRVGTKIRPALQKVLASNRFLCHGAYHDGIYRLALYTKQDDPGDAAAVGWAPCSEQWWLDLRDGPPRNVAEARWWGPQIYNMAADPLTAPTPGTYCMAAENRPGREDVLWGVHIGSPSADDEGYGGAWNVHSGLVLVQFDKQKAYDSAMNVDGLNLPPMSLPVPLEMEVENEITVEAITKSFSFGDPQLDKLFTGAELSIHTEEVAQIHWEARVDGGRFIDVGDIQIDHPDFMRATSEFQSLLLEPSHEFRDPGKFIQFRFFDVPGWPVVEGGINSQFWYAPKGVDLVDKFIKPGFYATQGDYLLALKEATVDDETGNWVDFERPAEIVSMTVTEYTSIFSFIPAGTRALRTQKILSGLGFNVVLPYIELIEGVPREAEQVVRYRLSSHFTLGGLSLRVHYFGRRPKHSKE
jgi:hypothetical protein